MNNSGKSTFLCDLISDSVPAWTELPESHFSEQKLVSFSLPHRGGPSVEGQKSLSSEWRSQNGMEFCSERHFPCLLSALCRNVIFSNQESVVLTSNHRVLSQNLAFFWPKNHIAEASAAKNTYFFGPIAQASAVRTGQLTCQRAFDELS